MRVQSATAPGPAAIEPARRFTLSMAAIRTGLASVGSWRVVRKSSTQLRSLVASAASRRSEALNHRRPAGCRIRSSARRRHASSHISKSATSTDWPSRMRRARSWIDSASFTSSPGLDWPVGRFQIVSPRSRPPRPPMRQRSAAGPGFPRERAPKESIRILGRD